MLAEKPWKLEAVTFLFLGVIATLCLGTLLAGLLGHFTTDWPKSRSDFWQIVLSASFLEIPALVGIGLFFWMHKVSWKDAFGLQMISAVKAVAWGLLAAALFLPVAWGGQWLSVSLMDLIHLKPESQAAVQELQDPSLTVAEKAILGVIAAFCRGAFQHGDFRAVAAFCLGARLFV